MMTEKAVRLTETEKELADKQTARQQTFSQLPSKRPNRWNRYKASVSTANDTDTASSADQVVLNKTLFAFN